MDAKKKKYAFPRPDKIVEVTENKLRTGEGCAQTSGGISPERADRLLRTVELSRAELDRALREDRQRRAAASAAPAGQFPAAPLAAVYGAATDAPAAQVAEDGAAGTPTASGPLQAAPADGGLDPARAAHLLHTAELSRAELLKGLRLREEAQRRAEAAELDEAAIPVPSAPTLGEVVTQVPAAPAPGENPAAAPQQTVAADTPASAPAAAPCVSAVPAAAGSAPAPAAPAVPELSAAGAATPATAANAVRVTAAAAACPVPAPSAAVAPAAPSAAGIPAAAELAAKTAAAPARTREEEAARAEQLLALAIALDAVGERKAAAPVPFLKRLFCPASGAFALLAALLLVPLFLLATSDAKLYYIYEDGALEAVTLSAADDYAGVFADGGLALDAADGVAAESLGGTRKLTVTRAYPVTVTADGKTLEDKVLGATAGQLLDRLGIAVGPDDLLTPAADTVLQPGDRVVVQRVTYAERTVTEAVSSAEVTKSSPLLSDGRTAVMNDGGGRDGVATRTYRDKYIDGALDSSTLLSETYETWPWDVVTLKGDSAAHMSPLDGSKYTDVQIVDNAPTSYTGVLENGVCTAYSFKPGTFGASGMYMVQGFVAVNPNVIPYGSLLYITSADGSFVYGWAVAADIGEAMMAGYVDIDLFFETYTESTLFGKHRMNVYIVDQLTQDQLKEYEAQPGMFRSRVPS